MNNFFRSAPGLVLLVVLSPQLRAETLAGKVVGPDDQPVAATVYYVQNAGWNATEKQVQTAADGTFRFEVKLATVPEGTAVSPEMRDRARGGVAVYAPGLSLGAALLAAGEEKTVKLTPPRKISGLLRDDKGAPVAGATLRVDFMVQDFGSRQNRQDLFFRPPAPLLPQFTAKTDATGAWEIAGTPPLATVIIKLDDDRYVDASAQFDGEGQPNGPGGRAIMARRAGTISGRVLDEKGAGAAGVAVLAASQPGQAGAGDMGGLATTAKDGTFRIARVVPGTYNLLISDGAAGIPMARLSGARRPSGASSRIAPALENVRVEAGQVAGGNTFHLVAPALVKGRVVDAKSGEPLSDVSVGAYGQGAPRAAGTQPAALTDQEGRFELALVPGANAIYAFEAERWGNNTPKAPVSLPVTLQSGQNKDVSLRIARRFADVQGQIVEENGAPAAGVEITVWTQAGTGQYLRSDQKGNFELKRMNIGSLRLDPRDEWTVVSPKNLILPAAAPVKIVVRRNRMARVTVRVVDAAGKPVEGVKMRFTMPIEREGRNARSILTPVSDAAGQYVFEALKMPEAMQIKLENAAKKGYQWRGGGETTGAKADEADFALSDIVMESLGAGLKGLVSGAGGEAAEGALVRSSGDNYENLARSDAAGRFELADQPQGEVELLAARNRDFGRVRARGDQAGATIVLQAGAGVPPRDIERAIALFREMAPSANERTLGEAALALAPHRPATALELLLLAPGARSDKARARIIEALPPDSGEEILTWAQNEVPQIDGDADFVRAGAILAHLLAARQPDAAKALMEQIELRRAKLTGDAATVGTAWAAGLAARLGLPAAPRLFDQALAAALRNPGTLGSVVEPLAAGTSALAEAILQELPEGSERNIYLYRRAIHQVARYDVAGAQRLLEQMRALVDAVPQRPVEDGKIKGRDSYEFDWAFAAKDVLRALPRSEVAAAAHIARRVQGWHRPSALTLAAEFGDKDQRLAMIGEAEQAETRGDWMENVTFPRLGALAAELDAARAAQLFEQSAQNLAEQRRDRGETSSTDWSFYASFWNPAQARLRLEADWGRLQKAPKPDANEGNALGWQQASLAMAMSAVDIDRALEWARQISDKTVPNNPSPRARALEFIGELLLQEPAKRRLLIISPESGFDS